MGTRKPRAIIIDDEPIIREYLREIVTQRGYEALLYADPTFCPIHGGPGDPCHYRNRCADVFLVDFTMSKMNGIEFLEMLERRECKADVRNKAIISGYSDDAMLKAVARLGCAFIPKPFRPSDIVRWLEECETRFNLEEPLEALQ